MFESVLLPHFVLFGGGIFDVFETLSELDFVVRVMVFSYLLFWLYTTFTPARAELLFGMSSIVAGYLVFAHGVTITILIMLFILFVILGAQLQMLIQFGFLPLMGYHGHIEDNRYVSDREIKAREAQGQQQQNAQVLAQQYQQSMYEDQNRRY
ncbi:MAG TPA: hypothetical protein VI875_00530 [Candidatus Norongarragalinales archaeon]|nr:hypothetical protein [Candidatus Norongarragalinales archaeon]